MTQIYVSQAGNVKLLGLFYVDFAFLNQICAYAKNIHRTKQWIPLVKNYFFKRN